MCGIVGAAGPVAIGTAAEALRHRGPDGTTLGEAGGVHLGHTRLAVRDTRPEGGGLYRVGPVLLAYNGELFNDATMREVITRSPAGGGHEWQTTGDTETVAAALAYLDPQAALSLLDGMFAVAWTDDREPGVLFAARDRFGQVPLHYQPGSPPMVASELKAFHSLTRRGHTEDIPAGVIFHIDAARMSAERFATFGPGIPPPDPDTAIREALSLAVKRRLVSDVPVCTLLSGGIDSAIIALELSQRVDGLTAYTAVMDPKSRDLKWAREVADYLSIGLVEVPIPVPTADDLALTVRWIEQPSKAQVEIAWPCLHLAEAIASDGYRVAYSGEGSDELWASYGFAYHGVKAHGWTTYRQKLIATQARRNFPRVNKSFMAAGVEGRLPFLDPDVVALALALPEHVVRDGPSRPKAILTRAYEGKLPHGVLTRPKLAFQDGLGMKAAAADVLANPGGFYRAEYARL